MTATTRRKKRSKKSKPQSAGSADNGLMDATTGDLLGTRDGSAIAGRVIEDRLADIVTAGGNGTLIVPRTSPHYALHHRCESPLRGVAVGSRVWHPRTNDSAIVTEISSTSIVAEMLGMDEGAKLVLGWDEMGWQIDRDAEPAPDVSCATHNPGDSVKRPAPKLHDIPIDQIAIVVEARGVDPAHVDRLAQALRDGDMLPPIEVYRSVGTERNEHYILGPGRHRLEAHKSFGRETIAAFVHPEATIDVIERAQLLENLNRNDMLPIEEAENVARLMQRCRDAAYLADHPDARQDPVGHVAAKIGRTRRWVDERMYIDRLTKPAIAIARRAQLPAGHLREVAKIGDPDQQFRLVCDAAGIAGWRLRPDYKTGKITGADEELAELDQRVAQGSHKRMTIEALRKDVESLNRPLRGVPWTLELPVVEPGKNGRTLPACAGCPHNSETDAMLFAVEGEQTHGVCHNASCYAAKKDAAEKAKTTLAKLAARKREPTPDQIREKAPKWMRDTTAVGLVKREFKKRQGATEKTAGASSNGRARGGDRKLTPHEKALEKFGLAVKRWSTAIGFQLFEALRDPSGKHWPAFVSVAVSSEAKLLEGSWTVPRVGPWYDEVRAKPTPPKPMNTPAKALIKIITDCDMTAAQKLPVAKLTKSTNEWQCPSARFRMNPGFDWHPDALIELADRLGIAHDPPPHWKDFAPGSERPPKPKQQKKRTTKKKSTRKKTSRKKTAGGGG